eukprot:TRINITY_DN7643_c0_g3_i3.p1 TRINITY_DN7643_c0_g3~~TRINITY_DN7643_c0_g3_i3.p1  ORF type:complete len:856 (+),score=220.20 TRINITY_DN7643_c0_g3_i3:70-2637(+)
MRVRLPPALMTQDAACLTADQCAEYFRGAGPAADAAVCGSSPCPARCLEEAEWGPALSALGRGRAGRPAAPVYLQQRDWISQQLVTTVARILLTEVMLYPVAPVAYDAQTSLLPFACCGKPLVDLELWNFVSHARAVPWINLDASPIGYEGISTLYVPERQATLSPMATVWTGYMEDARKGALPFFDSLPRASAANCTDRLKPTATECAPGNYVCDENPWSRSQCVAGQFVPEWCRAPGSDCAEVIMANPMWEAGWFEAVVLNLRLKFVLSYCGAEGLQRRVAERAARGENVMFYWWEPDPFLRLIGGAQAMVFPRTDLACTSQQATEPTESSVRCSPPLQVLMKVSSPEVAALGDLENFTAQFHFTAAQVNAMLADHRDGGGNATAWEAACRWVRANPDLWRSWIHNTPSGGEGRDYTAMLLVAIPVLALAFILGVAGAVALLRRAKNEEGHYEIREETLLYIQGIGEVTMHVLDEVTDALSLWQQVEMEAPLWVPFAVVFVFATVASAVAILMSLKKLHDVAVMRMDSIDVARRSVSASQAAVLLALLEDAPLLGLSIVSITRHGLKSTWVLVSAFMNAVGLGWKAHVGTQYFERVQRLMVVQTLAAATREEAERARRRHSSRSLHKTMSRSVASPAGMSQHPSLLFEPQAAPPAKREPRRRSLSNLPNHQGVSLASVMGTSVLGALFDVPVGSAFELSRRVDIERAVAQRQLSRQQQQQQQQQQQPSGSSCSPSSSPLGAPGGATAQPAAHGALSLGPGSPVAPLGAATPPPPERSSSAAAALPGPAPPEPGPPALLLRRPSAARPAAPACSAGTARGVPPRRRDNSGGEGAAPPPLRRGLRRSPLSPAQCG